MKKVITIRTSKGKIAPGSGTTHGLSDSPEYDCWTAMKMRCNKPTHPMYKHYGARGIKVADEWQHSFISFYDHVGPRPTLKHSLDRIDVNGNYEPGNVRWATQHDQMANTRSTGFYVGINYEKDRDQYRATITIKNKRMFLGRYKNIHDAIVARRKAEEEYGVYSNK